MSDSQATAEAPATAAPATEAGPESQPSFDVSDLSLEQAEALFRGESVDVPVKAGGEGKTTAKVEAPPAAKVEAPAGDKPPEAEAEATEEEKEETTQEVEAAAEPEAEVEAEAEAPEAEQTGIERPRLKDERDQLIAGIYMKAKRDNNPISWAEAEARVDGPKKEEVVEPPTPTVDYVTQISTLEGEIKAIEAKLAEFDEGLSTPEIRNLQRELGKKDSQLELVKGRLEDAATKAEVVEREALKRSDANREKAHTQALIEYPAVGDDRTPLGKAVAKRVIEMKDRSHPDHATLFSDSAPLIIARNVAAELGILPAKKKAVSPPAKPPVEAPPRKVMAPAPGSKTAVQTTQPAEDGKAQLDRALHDDSVSLADLDAVQGMPDPNKLLVGAVR